MIRDIHSHILFDVDDGAADMVEAADMLSAAKRAQISEIVATPHLRSVRFDMEKAKANFEQLKEAAQGLGVALSLGFEIDCNFILDVGIQNIRQYCIEGTEDVLLEFHTNHIPPNEQKFIYTLQREGVRVIIAHPERYPGVQQNLSHAERWRDMGCKMQIDATSLLQHLFARERKCAEAMLKRNMVDYVASDAHGVGDYEDFARVCKRRDIGRLLGTL